MNKQPANIIVTIVFLIVGISLAIKNWASEDFWNANIIDLLTVGIGVIVAFLLTQKKEDKRRRDDCIEHIIIEIEDTVNKDSNFESDRNALMQQTSCANKIKYLIDAGFTDIQADIKFIETQFNAIRDVYSNNNSDKNKLNRVKTDIDYRRRLIIDKCCKIRVGLYK